MKPFHLGIKSFVSLTHFTYFYNFYDLIYVDIFLWKHYHSHQSKKKIRSSVILFIALLLPISKHLGKVKLHISYICCLLWLFCCYLNLFWLYVLLTDILNICISLPIAWYERFVSMYQNMSGIGSSGSHWDDPELFVMKYFKNPELVIIFLL